MHACMHAFIQRNRGVSSPLTDHPLPISSIPRRGQRKISKSVQRSSPSGRVQKMHKIIGAPIIEPLFSLSSRLLQKQSHSSRHGTRPIPRWRSSTSSSSSSSHSLPRLFPVIEQPGSKEYFFRQNRRTPVARSTKYSTSPERVYPGKNQSIRSLADRRNIYPAVGSRRFTSPVRATLTSRAINLSTPQGSGRAYTRRRTLCFGTAWSWPRQTFGLKLGWEEEGRRFV